MFQECYIIPQMIMSIVAVASVLKAPPQYRECKTLVFEHDEEP
jgi:hypothetical protein